MEDDILTIEDVAKYVRVSERTVYDWAQKGMIPSGKLGNVWRFRKSDIENWVRDNLSPQKSLYKEDITVNIKNILSPQRVVFLNRRTKRDALVELAENLATAPQVKDKKTLVSEILRREDLMSTAIGKGLAFPHVRLSCVTDLILSVGISQCDIMDFDAIDGQGVRLIFMMAADYNQHSYYLKTLSYLISKVKDDSFKRSILNAGTVEAAYNILVK